jgi:hypothetical protein
VAGFHDSEHTHRNGHALLSQSSEKSADILRQRLRLFQRGKVSAAFHIVIQRWR